MHLISWGFRLVTGKEKAFCVFAGLTLGFLAVVHLPRPNQVAAVTPMLNRYTAAPGGQVSATIVQRAPRGPRSIWRVASQYQIIR